jgi:hypothetical protein
VDYFNLPQYLVNRIDNAFEVYEKEEEWYGSSRTL